MHVEFSEHLGLSEREFIVQLNAVELNDIEAQLDWAHDLNDTVKELLENLVKG